MSQITSIIRDVAVRQSCAYGADSCREAQSDEQATFQHRSARCSHRADRVTVPCAARPRLFPTATEEDPNCNGPAKPEVNDLTRTDDDDAFNEAFANPLHIMADWMQFSLLMRFMDAPQPETNPSPSAQRGRVVFDSIGCALCHTPQMQTAPVLGTAVLQDRPVNLFSDLMVHRMGPGLADDIIQGAAGPDEFRSQPLWGVGQRLFFLHDGRTSDLLTAIYAHRSPASAQFPASEANAVIDKFQNLTAKKQQAILDFLRSL